MNIRTYIRKSAFTAVLALTALWAQAGPEISFEETRHNFGKVYEEKGVVEHTFRFTNTGDEPLKILDVKSSCGCTSPGFTRDEVMPGEKGYIIAAYDPFEREGRFLTSLPVISNDPNNGRILLRVAGEVIPRTRSASEIYQNSFGSLLARTPNFFIGRFDDETTRGHGSFAMYNSSDETIRISALDAPDHIKFVNKPVFIEPGKEARIRLEYDAKAKNEYGFVHDEVVLHTSDPEGELKEFMISAKILAYLDEEDPDNAPRLVFDQRNHNFGRVHEGEVVSKKFEFTNKGNKKLEILRVVASCGCTVSDPDKKLLEPGESSFVNVSFNSGGRQGPTSQSVRVYSNDPKNPVSVIRINANVVLK